MGDKMKDTNPIKPGDRFGSLVAEKYLYRNKYYRRVFLFRCDCGNVKEIESNSIKQGKTKSCGCGIVKGNKLRSIPYRNSEQTRVFNNYITSSRKRNLKFSLSKEYFTMLTQMNCAYCGSKPSNGRTVYEKKDPYLFSGIDRVDNSKGYVVGNVVACCKTCNIAKASMTLEQFVEWIKRVHKWVELRDARKNERTA
jgi:5-methylcytosine-specific restriction endonuclease McrA